MTQPTSNRLVTEARLPLLAPNVFTPERYGAKGDGTTDDTAAVQSAIQAASNAGGGTVVFGPVTYLIAGQITLPNDGSTVPKQKPIKLLGAGSRWDGQWQNSGEVTGGTVLDLRYTTATANQAKIQSFGLGLLAIENMTLTQAASAADTTPFVYVTNTTFMARDVAVWGHSSLSGTACVQDAFMLGGTTINIDGTPTGAFQGYGTVIERCYFARIRRGVYGRSWVNNIQVVNNTWSASCGSDNTAAALQFDGSLASGSFCIGNRLAGNVVEITHYPYGFRFTQSKQNICQGNGFWDNSSTSVTPYLFEGPSSNSGAHIIDDFFPNTATGSEITANGLSYSMRKGARQFGTVLAGGNNGNVVQPQAATANENASLLTVKRSQAEATNSDATIFQMWQDGEFWAGSTWSANAALHVKNGSQHWWANAASSRVDSGDYQLLAGSDQPYRTVYVSRGLFRLPQMATASRPTATDAAAGSCYYDTTLGKPVFSDGTNWKDATGTVV